MFCTKCGKNLQPGEKCTCQASQQQYQPQSQPPQYHPQPRPQSQPTKTKAVSSDDEGISINFDIDKVKKSVANASEAAKKSDANIFERGRKIVPECVVANEGEVPIKQYNYAKMRSFISLSFAECRLQVTNKRMLLRATGRSITGKTVLQEEFKIDEIAGIEIKKRPRFSFAHLLMLLWLTTLHGVGFGIGAIFGGVEVLGVIMAILFSLAGAGGYIFANIMLKKKNIKSDYYLLKQVALNVVAGMVFGCIRQVFDEGISILVYVLATPLLLILLYNAFHLMFVPSLTTIIKTKGGAPGLELKRKEFVLFFNTSHEENSGFNQVVPWKDTDLVVKEIGTIIDDLQTIGDAAIAKWQKVK